MAGCCIESQGGGRHLRPLSPHGGRHGAFRFAWLAFLIAACATITFAAEPPAPVGSRELGWDETEKTFFGLPGDTTANFTFTARNDSSDEVTVTEITPSCGCTVVEMPPTPWTLAPGATRLIRV